MNIFLSTSTNVQQLVILFPFLFLLKKQGGKKLEKGCKTGFRPAFCIHKDNHRLLTSLCLDSGPGIHSASWRLYARFLECYGYICGLLRHIIILPYHCVSDSFPFILDIGPRVYSASWRLYERFLERNGYYSGYMCPCILLPYDCVSNSM